MIREQEGRVGVELVIVVIRHRHTSRFLRVASHHVCHVSRVHGVASAEGPPGRMFCIGLHNEAVHYPLRPPD